MVALLSVLSSFERLCLEFDLPQSHPGRVLRQSLPPLKRSILPALHQFRFKGVTEYIEELVTGIDAPQLGGGGIEITFFNEIDRDCPRLAQFMDRTPTLRALDEAHIQFRDGLAGVRIGYRGSRSRLLEDIRISVSSRVPYWQLLSIEKVCNSFVSPFSTIEDLYIECRYLRLVWKKDAIENIRKT